MRRAVGGLPLVEAPAINSWQCTTKGGVVAGIFAGAPFEALAGAFAEVWLA